MARITPVAPPAVFRFPKRHTQGHERSAQAVMRLIAFGFAGGSVTTLAPVLSGLPAWVDTWGAEYPGRGLRAREPLPESLDRLVDEFDGALASADDVPIVLFGYSFGAVVAFALAQRLSQRHRSVTGFIAMSAKAPEHVGSVQQTSMAGVDRLMHELRCLGGIPDEVWNRPDLLEWALSVARADLRCYEGFVRDEAVRMACPVLALHGSGDPLISEVQMSDWLRETDDMTGLSEFHSIGGAHFLHAEQESALQSLIGRWLQQLFDEFCREEALSAKTCG